jgi:predicted nucleic acid-binding protein
MIVVSNATPLIAMAMADRFDLLRSIFGRIYIPPGVYEEVVEEGGERFGAMEVRQAAWIQVIEAKDKLAIEVLEDDLGKGESETIVLAREMQADWVLVDERLARRKLELLDVPTIGTLGILLKAKELGLLHTIGPEVDKLRARGFRLGKQAYEDVLKMAGESANASDR